MQMRHDNQMLTYQIEQRKMADQQAALQRQFTDAQAQQQTANECFQSEMLRQLRAISAPSAPPSQPDTPIPAEPPLSGFRGPAHLLPPPRYPFPPSSVPVSGVPTPVPVLDANPSPSPSSLSSLLSAAAAPPANPGVFGLAALDPVAIPKPSGIINLPHMAFCGANVGPLRSASDAKESSSKKILSGEHAVTVEEVRSQLYWPHMVLDAVITPTRPDYRSLSPTQFAAGYSAMMLLYLPTELNNTPIANMLKHFNRIMSFAINTDWQSILQFNGQFLHACENLQASFANWEVIKTWHDRHLSAFRSSDTGGQRGRSSQSGAGNNNNDEQGESKKDKKDNPNFVSDTFLRKHHLCMKFQKGTCAEEGNHVIGSLNLVHACGLCLLKERGLNPDHGSKVCPRKTKGKGF
jgi:hypothetical protein